MDARKRDEGNSISSKRSSKGLILSILDTVSKIQVAHAYFKHLYILSVLSSVFWAVQILNKGNILRSVAGMMDSNGSAKSMSMNQIFLLWSFLLLQGIRRLLESVFVMKPSASKMWIVHYALGLGFYMIMGITVWIEGAGMSSRLLPYAKSQSARLNASGYADKLSRFRNPPRNESALARSLPFGTFQAHTAVYSIVHPRLRNPTRLPRISSVPSQIHPA